MSTEVKPWKYNNIRKSLIMAWRVCPRQAWYSVRDPEYGQYNEFNLQVQSLLEGQIFHKEMDKFYSKIVMETAIKLASESKERLVEYFKDMFSPTTEKVMLDYFSWYASIEADRLIALIGDGLGEVEKRFIPMCIEEYVEYDDNGIIRNGHFDRLDYLGPGKVRLVEYKTGFSYDVTKSYKLSKLRFELYWYKDIVEKITKFKEFTVVDWMLINPTTQTVFITNFSSLTKAAVEKALKQMIVDINGELPPPRNINYYCDGCKFLEQCLIKNGKNIFDVDESLGE